MLKIIISDLHLEETRPDIAEIFKVFLKKHTQKENTLYILGDFFEAWIGDDDLTPFNQSIFRVLREATDQGLAIYIMHGNRDFLLGKQFIQATGCQLLPDEYVLDLFGRRTLLMHGDTLCTADIKYIRFRKKTRCWLMKKLFLMKALEKRRAMAKQYREASKAHVSTLPDAIMDVTQEEVVRKMLKHNVQHLIHGHTHRKAVHSFELHQKPATRTVLDAWHNKGNALICEQNGDQYFITIE